MLDKDIIEQLHSVFSKLERSITLVYDENIVEAYGSKNLELKEMLNEIASTSDKISIRAFSSDFPKASPYFYLEYDGRRTGVSFSGIPGGHEFTSLIISILNVDGKGKFPDDGILHRIKNLKGPIHLKTFISLSCENCPEIIQALNLMSFVHPDFKHEMIDGEYFPEEIKNLKIQSVPSVISGNEFVSIGKTSLLDLVSKLETIFGKNNSPEFHDLNLGLFDMVVIGGGPAGTSAAIYAARKGFKTAILCEKLGGQVNETKGIENLISTNYTEGPELASKLVGHINDYPIKIFEHRRVKEVLGETLNKKIKSIQLESGENISARAIIVATGAKWRELNIQGEKEYLGKGVAFCPHCDGPFYKGKKVGVVGGGNSGVEAAIDLAQIAREIILFEFMPELKADKILVDKLKSLSNVTIITNAKTESIIGDGSRVNGIMYLDRASNKTFQLDLDGIFVQIGLVPNSSFLSNILEVTNSGEVIIDIKGRTSLKGIYAAGDVTTVPFKQIIVAMGEGAKAALTASEELMLDI